MQDARLMTEWKIVTSSRFEKIVSRSLGERLDKKFKEAEFSPDVTRFTKDL